MTALCGWIDFSTTRATSRDMVGGMMEYCGPSPRRHTKHEHGFCGTAGRNTWLSQEQGCLIAITGRPRWEGQSDLQQDELSRSILDAYHRDGWRFLQRLRGFFSIVINDLKDNTLLLAIDRAGTQSLSYQVTSTGVLFGSTLNALRAHPDFIADVSPQAIFNYLYFHMIPSPGCIYRHTSKLLPAQFTLFGPDYVESGYYWELEYADSHETEGVLADELKQRLNTAVQRSVDDSVTGCFLSGGLDSSTVTGCFQGLSDTPVTAFSIGFDAEGYDETPYARISAEHFRAKLETYYVTPDDVLQAIPRLAAHFDEPFGNASAIPAYYCALHARELGFESLLAGDGGDELFAGNARYAKQKVFSVYDRIPSALRNNIIEPIALHLPNSIPPLRKIRSYVDQARIPMPERMETYNFLHRTPLESIFNKELFLSLIDTENPASNIREVYHRTSSNSMLKRMLHMDLKITLADNDLRKVSQSCELAGMDVCFPMLDDDLVEFSATIPDRMLMRGFDLRSFYRRALTGFLPSATLSKSKHGFGLPFGVWMTEDSRLKELAYDSLTDFRKRDYMKSDYIDMLIESHRSGHSAYFGVMIWVILMLELWLQNHADG